jgi:hypothetical protein
LAKCSHDLDYAPERECLGVRINPLLWRVRSHVPSHAHGRRLRPSRLRAFGLTLQNG